MGRALVQISVEVHGCLHSKVLWLIGIDEVDLQLNIYILTNLH